MLVFTGKIHLLAVKCYLSIEIKYTLAVITQKAQLGDFGEY